MYSIYIFTYIFLLFTSRAKNINSHCFNLLIEKFCVYNTKFLLFFVFFMEYTWVYVIFSKMSSH